MLIPPWGPDPTPHSSQRRGRHPAKAQPRPSTVARRAGAPRWSTGHGRIPVRRPPPLCVPGSACVAPSLEVGKASGLHRQQSFLNRQQSFLDRQQFFSLADSTVSSASQRSVLLYGGGPPTGPPADPRPATSRGLRAQSLYADARRPLPVDGRRTAMASLYNCLSGWSCGRFLGGGS